MGKKGMDTQSEISNTENMTQTHSDSSGEGEGGRVKRRKLNPKGTTTTRDPPSLSSTSRVRKAARSVKAGRRGLEEDITPPPPMPLRFHESYLSELSAMEAVGGEAGGETQDNTDTHTHVTVHGHIEGLAPLSESTHDVQNDGQHLEGVDGGEMKGRNGTHGESGTEVETEENTTQMTETEPVEEPRTVDETPKPPHESAALPPLVVPRPQFIPQSIPLPHMPRQFFHPPPPMPKSYLAPRGAKRGDSDKGNRQPRFPMIPPPGMVAIALPIMPMAGTHPRQAGTKGIMPAPGPYPPFNPINPVQVNPIKTPVQATPSPSPAPSVSTSTVASEQAQSEGQKQGDATEREVMSGGDDDPNGVKWKRMPPKSLTDPAQITEWEAHKKEQNKRHQLAHRQKKKQKMKDLEVENDRLRKLLEDAELRIATLQGENNVLRGQLTGDGATRFTATAPATANRTPGVPNVTCAHCSHQTIPSFTVVDPHTGHVYADTKPHRSHLPPPPLRMMGVPPPPGTQLLGITPGPHGMSLLATSKMGGKGMPPNINIVDQAGKTHMGAHAPLGMGTAMVALVPLDTREQTETRAEGVGVGEAENVVVEGGEEVVGDDEVGDAHEQIEGGGQEDPGMMVVEMHGEEGGEGAGEVVSEAEHVVEEHTTERHDE